MIAPILTTERLTLRPYRLEDFETFAALWLGEDSKYMGGPLEDKDEAWGVFCSDVASWSLLGFGYWAIERTVDKALVGATGLGMPPSYPEREIGWHLYSGYRGRGYATESAQAARTSAFDTLGWDTIVSYIDPPNADSIAVAERLGATLDQSAKGPDPDDLVYRHVRGTS